MRNKAKKIIISVIAVFMLLFSSPSYVSAESVPRLTREYIQNNYEKISVNHNYSLYTLIVVFAVAAILIPAVFFAIEKIKKIIQSGKKKTAKKK